MSLDHSNDYKGHASMAHGEPDYPMSPDRHERPWIRMRPPIKQTTIQSVTCPARLRIHFVNKTTGKLLGEKEK